MFNYVNGSPIASGIAGSSALGLGNLNKQIQIRTSTNPAVGTIATTILPPLANIYLGPTTTYPARGAGSVSSNNLNANVTDRSLNTADSGWESAAYDLRSYRGQGLASGAYNTPYNTQYGVGSIYSYSNQYPSGVAPYNTPFPYPIGGAYTGPDFDLYGYDRQWRGLDTLGQQIIVPDASRGYNIDPNRGGNCRYIVGVMPDAARGFNIDPCTGYTTDAYRGCLSNAFGGNIYRPYDGLDYNPCTKCAVGSNPCGQKATAYGVGGTNGSTPALNAPYGLSSCGEAYPTNYPSLFGLSKGNAETADKIGDWVNNYKFGIVQPNSTTVQYEGDGYGQNMYNTYGTGAGTMRNCNGVDTMTGYSQMMGAAPGANGININSNNIHPDRGYNSPYAYQAPSACSSCVGCSAR